MFHVLGAIAEFERDLISERTRAGLEHAQRDLRREARSVVRDLQRHVAAGRVLEEQVTVVAATLQSKAHDFADHLPTDAEMIHVLA